MSDPLVFASPYDFSTHVFIYATPFIKGINFLTLKSLTSTRYFGQKVEYSQIFEYFEQILHISNFHGPKESCAVELCLLYENCTGGVAMGSKYPLEILEGIKFLTLKSHNNTADSISFGRI